MSHSDNSRRGRRGRSDAEKWLCKHHNRVMRSKVRAALRDGKAPASEQHRHSALWEAS